MKAYYLTVVENNVLRVQVNADSPEEAREIFLDKGLNSFDCELVEPYCEIEKIQSAEDVIGI